MELSNRLQAVAGLVSEGLFVADVGTDHGYIPIYLLESGRNPKAIAMDINRGPLLRAREHILDHGLSDAIEVRQSDGVSALAPGEAQTVVIAGMGGALTIKILTEGEAVFRSLREFVLQPQSEIEKVRRYLNENGYRIIKEDMVLEDGKYYPMMKAENAPDTAYDAAELRYGRMLMKMRHPVLRSFLEKEIRTKREIVQRLEEERELKRANSQMEVRIGELQDEIFCAEKILAVYFG